MASMAASEVPIRATIIQAAPSGPRGRREWISVRSGAEVQLRSGGQPRPAPERQRRKMTSTQAEGACAGARGWRRGSMEYFYGRPDRLSGESHDAVDAGDRAPGRFTVLTVNWNTLSISARSSARSRGSRRRYRGGGCRQRRGMVREIPQNRGVNWFGLPSIWDTVPRWTWPRRRANGVFRHARCGAFPITDWLDVLRRHLEAGSGW
jgi:hypothetical protein